MSEPFECCVCGRAMRKEPSWIMVDRLVMQFVAPDTDPDTGNLELFPIGPKCFRKVGRPRAWLVPPRPITYDLEVVGDCAQVIDDHGACVYEVWPDEFAMLIEDGDMKNREDMEGLAVWLVVQNIIPSKATIKEVANA